MKMLFEKLTSKDVSTITSYLDRYDVNVGSHLRRDRAPLSTLFRAWDDAKSEYLYRLFGEKFILEKEMEYTEPVSALSRKISYSYDYKMPMNAFYTIYRKWYDSLPFVWTSKEADVLWGLIGTDTLAGETCGDNSYLARMLPIEIDFGDGHKIKIEKNTKPMRALGKLVKMFNLDANEFENFRLEHSRIHNTKKLTGKLCLSIHPMDYMTMSMNNEKWSSCMNWREPGGYRGGTIEVMNSNATIVAYLKSDNTELTWDDDSHSWNSKKWRILITINETGIYAIKAYPYHNEEMTKNCIEWLKELARTNLNQHFGSVAEVPCCSTFHYPDTNAYYYVDFEDDGAMYCDWGSDRHYGCFNLSEDVENYSTEENPKTIMNSYCGPRTCMICGGFDEYYYDESYVICEDCCSNADDEAYYCEECGCYESEENIIFVDGHCYCENCINGVADLCAIDGNYYHYHNLRQVYLARENDNPNVEVDSWIYIHEDYVTHRYPWCSLPQCFTELEIPRKTAYGTYYFNREDLNSNALYEWYHLYTDIERAEYFAPSEEN